MSLIGIKEGPTIGIQIFSRIDINMLCNILMDSLN